MTWNAMLNFYVDSSPKYALIETSYLNRVYIFIAIGRSQQNM